MGCLGSCLRAVYHRMSPYLHRTARIHPGGKATLRGWSRIGQLSSNNTEQRVEVAFLGSSPGECLWSVIDKRIPQSPKQSRLSYGPTVYCYVVSTYDDFHSVSVTARSAPPNQWFCSFFLKERQVLANEVSDLVEQQMNIPLQVFPEIKRWCDSTSLQFIPIDFYWVGKTSGCSMSFLFVSFSATWQWSQDIWISQDIAFWDETVSTS